MKKPLLLACSLFALSACTKQDDATPSRQALLTARPWRISAHTTATTTAGSTSVTDTYAATPSCSLDDFFTFKPDNSLVVDEGATACDASQPQTTLFTWCLLNDQSQLQVAKPGNSAPETNEILELSATTLRVRATTTTTGRVKVETITFNFF